MGELNLSRAETDALRAVDLRLLDKLIEQCLHEERSSPIYSLRLEICGPYVASRLREFERALSEKAKAKAARKRDEADYDARRAGRYLDDAVQQMKERVATEEREGQLYYVDDQIMPPFTFSERLAVRVAYRWREAVDDNWKHGSITFIHDVVVRPNYMVPAPTRKPSAAKRQRDRQESLYREWEHLLAQGLQSVRDHFRRGGNGAAIPQTFQAKTDSHSGSLNNFSTQF